MRDLYVDADSATVRSGPGRSYKIIGHIKRNTVLPYFGKEVDGWYKVLYKNEEAWVSKRYTKVM